MRILYDYQIFNLQNIGGISRCFAELIKHMPQDIESSIGLLESNNEYILEMGYPEANSHYKTFITSNQFPGKKLLYKLYYNAKYHNLIHWDTMPDINRLYSSYLIKKSNYDVFHPTYFENYYLDILPKDKPMILTVHDLIPELYPNLFPHEEQAINRSALLKRADHIIAVSENTKKDIIRLYNIPEEKISVIYHGASSELYTPTDINKPDYPYILYVGARWHYKNFIPFCKVLKPVFEKYKDIKLVCTGSAFTHEERLTFAELGITDRVVNCYCKTTQEILDLYHNAICFVYPSNYEGFGIPILEAYKADCPVILNRTSCFPEIAGNAALYFSLNKESSDFMNCFEALYLDSATREKLLHLQRERLKLFSWEKAANDLSIVYKQFANTH